MILQASTVAAPVVGWGTAILTSLTAALAMFFAAIPRIIGFVVVVAVGWWVAGLVAKAIRGLLRRVHFDRLAERAGIADFIRRTGTRQDAAGIVATAARWFIRVVVLVVAFDSLGLTAVSGVLEQLLLWLPNLVVAMVVLILGGLIARVVGDLARGTAAKAEFGRPDLVATIARVTIIAFTVVVALNQLRVAQVVVNTLLIGVVGAVSLALALAFGLGGRRLAEEALSTWRENAMQAAPRMRRAAEAARQEAADQAEEAARLWAELRIADRRRGADDRRHRSSYA